MGTIVVRVTLRLRYASHQRVVSSVDAVNSRYTALCSHKHLFRLVTGHGATL